MRFGKVRQSIRMAATVKSATKLRDWSGRVLLGLLSGFYSYEFYHLSISKSELESPYRMPELGEYIITNSSVDWGKIVYKSDGSFGQRSPLNPDEQELFHKITEKIKDRLSEIYPNRELSFVPTFMGNKAEENADIFDLFVIYDPQNYRSDIAHKLRQYIFNLDEVGVMERKTQIDDNKLYVFINSTAFFTDVIELSVQLESMLNDMSKLSGSEEEVSIIGDSESLFRFCRSFTTSESQREALLSLSILLDKYFCDSFPYYQIQYSPFAVGFISQFAFQSYIMAKSPRMTMNPAAAIMLGFAALLPTTAISCQCIRAALFSRYEENKRRMLHWYIDHMPISEVKGLLTHCYRAEDRKDASKGLFNDSVTDIDLSMPTEFVLTFPSSPFALKSSEHFYQSVITHCIERLIEAKESIEAEPYEVYKDDEGFDYVYVA